MPSMVRSVLTASAITLPTSNQSASMRMRLHHVSGSPFCFQVIEGGASICMPWQEPFVLQGCGLGLFGTRNELLQRYLAEKAQADNAAAQTLEAQKAALLPFLSERTERLPANAPSTGSTTEEQLNQQLLAEVLRAYTVSGTGKSVLNPCSLDAMQAPQPNMKRQNHKRKNITGILYKVRSGDAPDGLHHNILA